MASDQSQFPNSKFCSLDIPAVGQEDRSLFNLTPLLPPVKVNEAPEVKGNPDDVVVTIPPGCAGCSIDNPKQSGHSRGGGDSIDLRMAVGGSMFQLFCAGPSERGDHLIDSLGR